jgi:hypothetical protein
MLFCHHQPCFAQDGHVMGDCGLGKFNVVLHVTGAHAYGLADGALSFFLQEAEDLQARRIGDGLEGGDELFVCHFLT